jgi:putative SOS response-associated peptidase YedK
MCGRFSLTRSAAEVAEHFGLREVPSLGPRYNVAPGQPVLVVRQDPEAGARRGELRVWGLLPRAARRASSGWINARIESAAERPAFRDALRGRRCLVPADGFYEWSGSAPHRAPHHLALPGGPLFAMAGLYDTWRGPDGEVRETCAVLTTAACAPVQALHDRMPVLLAPSSYAAWLDPGLRDPEAVRALVAASPGAALVARRVGPRVNDPRHDEPACLDDDVLPLFAALPRR